MTADAELAEKIIAAVTAHAGLRPAAPITGDRTGWWSFDARKYAVGLTSTMVEVRVVATALPLTPLLDDLAAAIRRLLSGTRWETAELRLMVTELDAAALSGTGGDAGHPSEA
ncbi:MULTISPECIES: hypothetical protein [Nocardia]|uniref:hypothetical protein n=1 Tax=Nocardia TaxID=1817 RepID=UPI0018936806|nr:MULTISPECIES: hypothetical protein [Nocardia]MBF6351602.1 hypothetical protein [Nocardia flavorosea]